MRKYMRRAALDMVAIETTRTKIAARLRREGWTERHGGDHDVFSHTEKPGRIVVPRQRVVSMGVARAIAKQAGWT
jgi:hypothetical protein